MSWHAHLIDDRGHEEGWWNYTHNCNGMIRAALEVDGFDVEDHWLVGPSWWKHLDGRNGAEGGAFLDRIIRNLEADPARFRAMNPPNGWGDYDSLAKVLTEMRNAVPEWPCAWSVHG
jgi:hypothetical protein